MRTKSGSVEAFDQNWKTEAKPFIRIGLEKHKNQIQLAFRQHWLTFNEIIGGSGWHQKVP